MDVIFGEFGNRGVYLSRNTDFSLEGNSLVKIPFSQISGNENLFEIHNGGIKVKSNFIKSVTISGGYQVGTSQNCYIYLFLNDTQVGYSYRPSTFYIDITRILPIKKNDVIEVKAYIEAAGPKVISRLSDRTFLQIKA